MSDEQPVLTMPAPHEGQQKVLKLTGRYRVAVCGRRFGKTVAAAIAAVTKCEEHADQRVWWLAPIQAQAERVEREVCRWLAKKFRKAGAKKTDGEKERRGDGENADEQTLTWEHLRSENALLCSNGSRIEFHNAQNADNLRGAGLDLVIIDEAADISEYTWLAVIKPMLLDKAGEAFIIGTPRGSQHWLHRVFLRGKQDDENGRYASIQLPSRANPALTPEEIEANRGEMSDAEFRQEYEAEFIDGVQSVFTKVNEALSGELLQTGQKGARYVTGVDLGRRTDFTVLCSIGVKSGRLDGFERFNTIDWALQVDRIEAHLRAFPGPCVIERNAMGDVIYEAIRESFPEAWPYDTTAFSKQREINALALAISKQQLKLANVPVLVNELHAFAQLPDPQDPSRVKLGAPAGLHDDCVMALALAWWGCSRGLAGAGTGNGMREGLF